jgi:hypothetical protein
MAVLCRRRREVDEGSATDGGMDCISIFESKAIRG